METKRKRLSREEKRLQVSIDLLNKMFEIAGHDVTFEDIKGRTDNWYAQWSMTVAQADEWKAWGVEYLRKNLKLNKKQAEGEMNWFNLQYGLTYSDWNEQN